MYLCLESDGQNLALAPCHREIELAAVLETFGRDYEVCTWTNTFERPHEQAATQLHDDYQRHLSGSGIDGDTACQNLAEGSAGRTDSWIIDLVPPGLSDRCMFVPKDSLAPIQPILPMRHELREQQYKRATAYVVERSDFLLCLQVGEHPTQHVKLATEWWGDPKRIPKNLSSLEKERRPWGGGRPRGRLRLLMADTL